MHSSRSARGDWLGAGLSGISIVPYIGDLAKAGKLPRYSRKLYDAIQLARQNAEFAKLLRPVLEKLKALVDTIPTDISPELADWCQDQASLDDYLEATELLSGSPWKNASSWRGWEACRMLVIWSGIT